MTTPWLTGDAADLEETTPARGAPEAEIKRSLSLLNAALEATADGILVVDGAGRVSGFNRRFRDLWRLPESLLDTRDDATLIAHVLDQLADPGAFVAKVRELYAHPRESSFDILEFKDGRAFERLSHPQTIDGEVVGRVWSFRDVSERRRAESALRRSEEYARHLFQRSPIGIVLTRAADGTILEANEAFARTVGRTVSEVVGLRQRDLIPPSFAAAGRQLERELAATRRFGPLEECYLHRDGRLVPVVANGLIVERDGQDHVLSTVEDVSESRRAQVALAESEQRWSFALESIGEGVWDWNVVSGVVFFSRSWKDLLGHAEGDVGDRLDEWLSRVHADDLSTVRAELDRLLRGESEVCVSEHRLRARGGEYRWFLVRGKVTARTPEGKPARIVGTHADVTDRRLLEEKRRHAQKLEAVGSLAGGIAHDFNNLLVVIMGSTDLLRDRLRDDRAASALLGDVAKAGRRAADLTRQLLAYSRRQILQPRPVDLGRCLASLSGMLRRLIGEDVELRLEHEARGWVTADPGQLEQVVMNLAVNARDAMPEGGLLTIATDDRELDASAAQKVGGLAAGRYVALAVTDTGTGMSQEVLERIFEPFFTTKEVGKGTGLGLSTVHGIVHQSGGGIVVSSRLGHGTTFEILLPRTEPARENDTLDDPATRRPIAPRTVLLVEDEAAVQDFLSRALVKAGYHVLTASSATGAKRVLEGHRGPLHLLLTDVVMPGGNGVELARELVAGRPGLRTVIMSGYDADSLDARALQDLRGVFLQKPFAPDELIARLREVLAV